jgi:hypothetical protein
MGISESWKKAWEARNEISFGQALTTQLGGSLSFLPDDLTPKFMDSDFDIYDDKQREEAFSNSLMGRLTSGTVDTITQFAGDVSIVGGKFVATKRAADSAKDAILALREVRSGIPTTNKLADKYSRLADDFANNDIAWAQNHPWVKGSNNQATVSYLLGTTATKEEAIKLIDLFKVLLNVQSGGQPDYILLKSKPDPTQLIESCFTSRQYTKFMRMMTDYLKAHNQDINKPEFDKMKKDLETLQDIEKKLVDLYTIFNNYKKINDQFPQNIQKPVTVEHIKATLNDNNILIS